MQEIKGQTVEIDNSLVEDRVKCEEEIAPILSKYNLTRGARLVMVRNGILAVPELIRPLNK